MGKIITGLIIGLLFGAAVVVVAGSVYYKDMIESINADYDADSNSFEDIFREQIENIGQLLDSSESDYTELETEYQNLKDDYDELSTKYDELMDDYSLVLGEIPLTPDRTSTELIRKEYQWDYLGKAWELSIAIPSSISDFYENHDRIQTEDYSVYVTHPFDDEYLKSVLGKLNVIAIQEDLTESEKVNLLISFVQSLPYTYDNVSTPYDEYPRFPIETLIYGGGDCEDTSILTAALLYEMDYAVILINPPGHMAVGIDIAGTGNYWTFEETNYYYIETTGKGWLIGECPEEFKVPSHLYGLTPMPVITHSWEASWNDEQLEVSVTVENTGTTIAEGYTVWVAFDAGDGLVWNQQESESFDLQFGRTVTIDLIIVSPKDQHTRLIVEVVNQDGYYISQSYSEWVDT